MTILMFIIFGFCYTDLITDPIISYEAGFISIGLFGLVTFLYVCIIIYDNMANAKRIKN